MVLVLLTASISRGLRLQPLISAHHFGRASLRKIVLMASIVMGLSSPASNFRSGWLGSPADRESVVIEFTGPYWALYAAMLLFNVGVLQYCRWPQCASISSRSISRCRILILIGMWL